MLVEKSEATRFQDEILSLVEELARLRIQVGLARQALEPERELELDLSAKEDAEAELELEVDLEEVECDLEAERELDSDSVAPIEILIEAELQIEVLEERLTRLIPAPEPLQVVNPDSLLAAKTAVLLERELGEQEVYEAEKYTIVREGERYTIQDPDNIALLEFSFVEGQVELLADRLSAEDREVFKQVATGIETPSTLRTITADASYAQQVEKLRELAPRGSKAAQSAHYILEGRKSNSETVGRTTFSRSDQGLRIERDGRTVLLAQAGKIRQELDRNAQRGFERFHQICQQHPLNSQVHSQSHSESDNPKRTLALRR